MWVARDESKQLSLWYNKPIRQEHKWYSNDGQFILDDSLYPDLTWEDEPEEVMLVMKNSLHKIICNKCGKEFKYHTSDIKELHDCQPSSGYEYGADYVNCPHCDGYNELSSW